MWGSAQQVSGPPPCSQGLEDMETKAPAKCQGHEAEDPRKVTGDKGQGAQGWPGKRGCPLSPSFPLPAWWAWESETAGCSEQAWERL